MSTITALPRATVGKSYYLLFTDSGYTLAVTAGALPAGLTFNVATNVLSGTPQSAVGSPFLFTLTYTNSSSGVSSSLIYSLAVVSPLGTSPNAIYVENLYGLLLHRAADPGAVGWVSLLNQGHRAGRCRPGN